MRRLFLLLLLAFSWALPLAGSAGAWADVSQASPAYVALGDSLAVGVGASDPASKGYVPLVHQALRNSEPYQQRGLVLVNLGVSGATSADLLEAGGQLEQALAEIRSRQGDAEPANEVEIITVDIGGNDFLPLAREGSPCVAEPLGEACLARFTEALAAYEQNLRQALRALRQAAPEAKLAVLGLYNNLVGTPLEGAGDLLAQQINGVTARVAGEVEIGARMADPFSLFRQRPASEVISPDGVHPTDTGHALLAEALLTALQELQRVLPGPSPAPAQVPTAGAAPPADGSPVPLLLAIALPAGLLGLAALGGACWWGRGLRRARRP